MKKAFGSCNYSRRIKVISLAEAESISALGKIISPISLRAQISLLISANVVLPQTSLSNLTLVSTVKAIFVNATIIDTVYLTS
jgi:hypothetical protein